MAQMNNTGTIYMCISIPLTDFGRNTCIRKCKKSTKVSEWMRMNGKKVETQKVVCIKMHALVKKNSCHAVQLQMYYFYASAIEHSKTTVSFSVGFSHCEQPLSEYETSSLQFTFP